MGKVKIAIDGLIAIPNHHSLPEKNHILNILNFRYHDIFLGSFQCPHCVLVCVESGR